MKDDFQRLEDDMTHLGSRMEEITASSTSINKALADRKKEISKLCGVHHLLKKVRTSPFSKSRLVEGCSSLVDCFGRYKKGLPTFQPELLVEMLHVSYL